MKKIIKIFASVLALSMAMSTVVMPITAEAAGYGTKYVWKTYTNASDCEGYDNLTQADGLAGKPTSDKVAHNTPSHTGSAGWGKWYAEDVLTVEAQVYVPSGGKIEIYVGSNYSDEDRPGFAVQGSKLQFVKANGWVYTDVVTDLDATVWHKVAMTMNRTAGTVELYLDGAPVHTATGITYNSSGITQDIRIQNNGYIDNFHIYAGEYDANNDIMPAIDNDSYTFLADSMTVAEAKAVVMANQNAETAVARVYKGAVGGTEAGDAERIQAGWNVVVTSLSGDFYHSENVHPVVKSVEIAATLSDGTLTATLTKLTDNVIPSMIMVLVQNNGQVVKASETKTDVGLGVTTFTISDVGTSLVNPQIFFINTWDELAPALDEITSVTQ